MTTKNEINLPKGYLSYSSATLWHKNKDQFRERYYKNAHPEESVPMIFGKKIAEMLEYKRWSCTENRWIFPTGYEILSEVPFYPISEQPLVVNVDGVMVKGFLDLFNPRKLQFSEIKTGSVSHTYGAPWDMVKVMKHDQLPWYSFLIKESFGDVEPECKLIWIPTRYKKTEDQLGSRMMEGESRELELTGEKPQIFKRVIEPWERKRIRKMIVDTALEITKDYNEWLKTNQ